MNRENFKNVLFVFDKWTCGNPAIGYSTHFDDFLETYRQTQLRDQCHTLHYDESLYVYGVHIDKILVNYCLQFQIKILYLCFSGQSPANPSIDCLKKLKEIGVFICVFWPDNNPMDLVLRERLKEIIGLNVVIDNPKSNTHNVRPNDRHLYLWSPDNLNLYFPDQKDIDVSFIGSSRYVERQVYLQELKSLIPYLVIGGGQRESQLSSEAFATLIRKSKMSINFCKNPMGEGYEQTKGRVFEAIASKSLLFEEKNSSTPDFFTPNEHYVEFSNAKELADKVDYFKNNIEEREVIINKAYEKYVSNYTHHHFWSAVLTEISKQI